MFPLQSPEMGIAVFCICVGAAWMNCSPHKHEDARPAVAAEMMKRLASAIKRFHNDCGVWPTGENMLEQLHRAPDVHGWDGPYVKSETALYDSWGTMFLLQSSGDAYHLVSAGNDTIFNTRDDIRLRIGGAQNDN
jgi:hypothetical protein